MCYSLSETSAVDLGDGVRSHGTPDTGAGRRTLGHGGDAVGRVLTGWGEGRITGDTETSLCQNNSRDKRNKLLNACKNTYSSRVLYVQKINIYYK